MATPKGNTLVSMQLVVCGKNGTGKKWHGKYGKGKNGTGKYGTIAKVGKNGTLCNYKYIYINYKLNY